jgi:hypothetical protein
MARVTHVALGRTRDTFPSYRLPECRPTSKFLIDAKRLAAMGCGFALLSPLKSGDFMPVNHLAAKASSSACGPACL